MNRWICLSATAALLMTGCNEKERKSSPSQGGYQPRASAYADESNGGNRLTDGLMAEARAQADALQGASSGSGNDAGRRFFDGQTLSDNGFALPDGGDAVAVPVTATGAARRKALPAFTPVAYRRKSDLATGAPPAPQTGDDFAPSAEAVASGAGKVLAAFDGFQRRMFPDAAPILSRSGWHAAKRKGSAVAMHPTHVTVHHTEGPQTMSEAETAKAVRNIQHYHMAGRALEGKDTWDDIGYHFLIDGSGRVSEGRPAETLGAHAGGANQDNIGISMMGNFNRQHPTVAQQESLTRLVAFLALKYGQDPSKKGFLEPHRHYDQTDCPGKNMMSILDQLRARINTRTEQLDARLRGAGQGEFIPGDVTDA